MDRDRELCTKAPFPHGYPLGGPDIELQLSVLRAAFGLVSAIEHLEMVAPQQHWHTSTHRPPLETRAREVDPAITTG